MKTLILFIGINFFSLSSKAFEAGQTNIHGGLGVYGTRGLIGASLDKFVTDHQAVSVAVGADFVGLTSSVGYKYFWDAIPKTTSAWHKCFFVWECDNHPYLGASFQYAGTSTSTITESGVERKYTTAPKYFALLTGGWRTTFKNNVTMDLELSYRGHLAGGEATLVSGAGADDNRLLEQGYRSLGANIGVGYLF